MSTITPGSGDQSTNFSVRRSYTVLKRAGLRLIAKWAVIAPFAGFVATAVFVGLSQLAPELGDISVPQGLLDRGYTSRVIAARVADAYYEMQQESRTSFKHVELNEAPNALAQTTDITLTNAVRSALHFLHLSTGYEIDGEVTEDEFGEYFIKLRVNGRELSEKPLGPFSDPEMMWQPAALAVLRVTEPYVLAVRAFERRHLDEADSEARAIVDGLVPATSQDIIYAHILLGNIYRLKGNDSAWLKQIQIALTSDSLSYTALNNLGAYYATHEHSLVALVAIVSSIAISYRYPGGYENLGEALAGLGLAGLAEHAFRVAIELDPNNPSGHMALGALYYRDTHNTSAAIREYRTAAASDRSGAAHLTLGTIYAQQLPNEIWRAISEYRAAIEQNHQSDDAHDNLGVIYSKLHKFAAAMMEYGAATRINPNNFRAHNHMGETYEALGDVRGAMKEYHAAIAVDPKFIPALKNLSFVYERSHDIPDAMKEYRAATAIIPTNDMDYVVLGEIYNDAFHDYHRAMGEYRTAITMNPYNGIAHNHLGVTYLELNENNEALKELKVAATIDHNDYVAHSQLGYILQKLHKYRNAAKQYEAAIAIDQQNAKPHIDLASIYVDFGDLGRAIREYRKAIAIRSSDDTSRRNLSLLYALQNNTSAAIQELQTAPPLKPDDAKSVANELLTLNRVKEACAMLAEREDFRTDIEDLATLWKVHCGSQVEPSVHLH